MKCPECGTTTSRDVTEDLYPKWLCPKCHFEWNESDPDTMYDSLVRQGTYYKDAYKRAYGWKKKAPKSILLSTPNTIFKWPNSGWLTYDFGRRYTPLNLRVKFAIPFSIAALLFVAICVFILGFRTGFIDGKETDGPVSLLVFLIIIETLAVVPWTYSKYDDMSQFLEGLKKDQVVTRNHALQRLIRARNGEGPLYNRGVDISGQSEEEVFFKVLSNAENSVASRWGHQIAKHPEFACDIYFKTCTTCLPYH